MQVKLHGILCLQEIATISYTRNLRYISSGGDCKKDNG